MVYVIKNIYLQQYFSGYDWRFCVDDEYECCEWSVLEAGYVETYTSLEAAQKELTRILNGFHYEDFELEIEEVV